MILRPLHNPKIVSTSYNHFNKNRKLPVVADPEMLKRGPRPTEHTLFY